MTTRMAWIGAGLWALAACHEEPETRCGEGTELVARRCVPIAQAGSGGAPAVADAGTVSCGEGTREVDGRCVALKPIGDACESGAECASGSCLSEDRGAIGGYCTIAGCSENRPCPAGSHCTFSSRNDMSLCLAYCDDDQDCRGDYVCQPLYTTDVHVCAPKCTLSEACPSGTICDDASGKCKIHQCELGTQDACGPDSDDDFLCFIDRLGLTTTGGICLPYCDPQDPSAKCARNEVCQPLPDDPQNVGFCAPPVCETSESCPAGSLCIDQVCQPPLPCDDDGECAGDDRVCVAGRCVAECPSSGDCSELQSTLSCAEAAGACLPTGSFPGSPCRNALDAPCDAITLESGSDTLAVPMLCNDPFTSPVCVVPCEAFAPFADGNALCAAIDPDWVCNVNPDGQDLCGKTP